MMHFNTRMTSLVLVFGIFFTLSCSTLSLTNESAESLYEDGKYKKALSSVNKSIEENPGDVDNQILKAHVLREIALEERNPSDRKPYYQNFKDVVDEVRFTSEDYRARTDSILVKAWSYEQSEGVRHLQEDDTDTYENHFDRIIAHLENASIIIPDSLITYSLKATTFYRHGDTQKAISTLEKAENNGVTLTPESQEKIAFLYLESGNLDKSIEVYRKLVDQHTDNQEYRHGLINALILNENHEESVALLKDLSDRYPNRDEYVETLASEQFFQISQEIDDVTSSESRLTTEVVNEFVLKLEEVGELFQSIDSDRPASEEHQYRVASFYTDAGKKISSFMDYSDEELTEEISSHADDFHRYSLPYWQQLTESYPESRDYFQKLYETYQLLEMQEEAEMLEQRINF